MTAVGTRRKAIATLIRGEAVASQEELVERLASQGVAVAQATVSRDLEAIGAVKVKRDGRLAYALPDELGASDWAGERLSEIVAEWVIDGEIAGAMIVLRARPGSAHVVGAALDQTQLAAVAGTIAGDDTLFIAVRDGHDPAQLLGRLVG